MKKYFCILNQNQFCSIDNLALLMETANAKEGEKQEYINIPEKILNNAPLETIKVLRTLSKETLIKPKIQNGISVVSNYLQKNIYKDQK